MLKFWMGVVTGAAVAVTVNEILKRDDVKDSIESARSRIYDAIGDLLAE